MKKYFLCVTLLFVNLVIVGILLPMLFSAASTEAVILGIIVLIAIYPMNHYIIKLFNHKRGNKA